LSAAPAGPLVLTHGDGSLVHTDDGRVLVDLELGFGAAFLGHNRPEVTACLRDQAGRLMSSGRHGTGRLARIQAHLDRLLPKGLQLAGVYSTGMEVAEFALRIAATQTGRREYVGFARSMHGKSTMTAALCWNNAPLQPGGLHVLPFVADAAPADILHALRALLANKRLAAVLMEPIQGSNFGHAAPVGFYDEAIRLCREAGTLSVFDETLTGLYRTGPAFYANRLQESPDVLLFAKSLGNGFPVAALALRQPLTVLPAALPGSTFSANPMALAAIEATLNVMQGLPLSDQVAAIETAVQAMQQPLSRAGVQLRGRGALWCMEFQDADRCQRVHATLRAQGLLISCTSRGLRLVPAATIEPAVLTEACRKIVSACEADPA